VATVTTAMSIAQQLSLGFFFMRGTYIVELVHGKIPKWRFRQLVTTQLTGLYRREESQLCDCPLSHGVHVAVHRLCQLRVYFVRDGHNVR
jgi:hypothetical protein